MKKLLLATMLAAGALGAAPAGASQATNKTTFSVGVGEGVTSKGQVVATRAKKSSPVWHSVSVTLAGVPVTDDNGTTEPTEAMPDPTADDRAIEYCLYRVNADESYSLEDRGAVDPATGAIVLDFGTHEPLPWLVVVVRCDTYDVVAVSNSAIVAPASSAK